MINKNSSSKSSGNLYKRVFKNFPFLAYLWKRVEDNFILIDLSYELEKRCNISLENYKGVKASELYKNDPEILSYIKRCLNEKSIISKEMIYKFKLIEREKFVNVTYRYIPDDLVLVYIEDISEQKEIEESLKKEEKEKSIFLEAVSEHIIHYNKDFNIVSANKAAADSISLSPEQLIGRKCYELWHNRSEPCEGCPVLKAFKKGKLMTAEMNTPDGRVWFVKGHPIYDNKGDIIGVIEITREITKLKQIEQKLKESEQKYRNLIERSKDVIFQVDLKNNIIFANKACLDIFGYSPEEFKGISGLVEKIIHPNFKKQFEEFWSNYNSCKKFPEQTTEWCWIRKDGRKVYTENTFINLFDQSNRIIGFETVARDITEKKKAEMKLKESEEKYRNLIDNILDQIIETNLDGTVTYVSPQVYDLFGYKPEEVVGQRSIQFVHPDDIEIIKESMEKSIKSGEKISSEYRLKHKKGYYIDVASRGKLIKRGNDYKLIAVIRDITAQKRAENKIRDSELQYRTTLNSIGDPLHVIDKNRKIILINPALEQWLEKLNLSRNVKNQKLDEFFPFLPENVFREYEEVFRTGQPILTEDETKIGENIYYTETRKIPIFREGIVHQIITFIRDITDRKEADLLLKESEEKFRTIAEQSFMSIVIIQDGIMKYFNERVPQVNGYSVEEIKNWKPYEFAKLIHPDDRDFVMEQAKKKESGEKGVIEQYKYRLIRKDGEIRWLENFSKTISYKGSPADFLMSIDITEQMNAEKQLKKSEKKFREAYNRANFYKDLFAHDMSNILQNIYSAYQLGLIQIKKSKDLKNIYENLDIIVNQVNRGAKLISNVRKLSELENSDLHIQPIDALHILKKCIKFVLNMFQNRKINFKIDSQKKKFIVKVNNLLEDVFENILINAVKHNQNSPIEVLIEVSKVQKEGLDYVKFEFKDNGIGIADVNKELIFQRAFNKNVSGMGMGIGLSLVKKILEIFNGQIWVEDKVKGDYLKGSNFIILIPEFETN